jgi:endonuclease/exonuclease/phosphatase (EEP) superfamily protein YafD
MWRAAAATFLFALVNLAPVLPLYLGSPRTAAAGTERLRLLLANVNWHNREGERLAGWIEETQPDVVVILEATPAFVAGLEGLAATFPYRVQELHPDPRGIALLSRRPLQAGDTFTFTRDGFPTAVARLAAARPLAIAGTHPPPPRTPGGLNVRNEEMAALAQWVRRQPGEVIVLADLNSSPWSPSFANLLRATSLRDARAGFGRAATWPVFNPLLRIPLDYTLVSEGILVHHFDVGPDVGSDHFPVIVDVSLKE